MAGNQTDRRDYDTAASQTAQEYFLATAARLETLIDQRNTDVRQAMADYTADGVAEDYAAKELRWKNAADNVKSIIDTVRKSLEQSDESAQAALQKAKSAVANIG
ncbi:MAG: pore-forming ESAT-6 family protein [Pseudolysinimonas sp.]|uniref:pore-forming ESAT-6 family protein n=1 Tax=Pseudolysinimonas sp. TaxID=2680009 RepID=UPI003262E7CE